MIANSRRTARLQSTVTNGERRRAGCSAFERCEGVRHGFAIPHRQDDDRGAGRAFEAAVVADASFALDDAEPILLIGELRDVFHAQQWRVARARIGDLDQSRRGRRIEQEPKLKISEPSPLRLLH